MKQKLLLFTTAILLSATSAFAQGGTTGPLTWNISDDILTISGNGNMLDYTESGANRAPWAAYASSFHAVIVENGVKSVGNDAFSNLDNFTSISIPNSVTRIGAWAFYHCVALESVVLPSNLTLLETGAFYSCHSFKSIIIPDGVKTIADKVFTDCKTLTSVHIPNSVTNIGIWAFYLCDELESVTIPNSVTDIGSIAFGSCSKLKTVNFNAVNCKTTATNTSMVFNNCNAITTLNIGSMVQTIPANFFKDCASFTSITTDAINPPTLVSNTFPKVPKNIPVYIPCNTYNSYINAPVWSSCFNNFVGEVVEKQNICMITVDENYHNEIVWKKQDVVEAYNIYREGTQSGNFELVATIDYGNPNKWVDMESNAKTRSYRYKISAKGTVCNTESILSDAHKTMHLTINAGMGNSWNLLWTPYEGINYSTYNIYRSSGGTGEMELIETIPAGNTTFTDFTAPQGYVYYMVEILLNETCSVGKAGSSIKSNVATNNYNAINENALLSGITVYPNPTTGELTIDNGQLSITNVEIFDVYGRNVGGKFPSNELEGWTRSGRDGYRSYYLTVFPAGVYFLRIQTEKGMVTEKVIKY